MHDRKDSSTGSPQMQSPWGTSCSETLPPALQPPPRHPQHQAFVSQSRPPWPGCQLCPCNQQCVFFLTCTECPILMPSRSTSDSPTTNTLYDALPSQGLECVLANIICPMFHIICSQLLMIRSISKCMLLIIHVSIWNVLENSTDVLYNDILYFSFSVWIYR